jgi:Tol biopolymer transport system component
LLFNVNRSKYESRLVFATRETNTDYYDLATTRLDGSDFRLLTDTPKVNEQDPHVCYGNQKIVYVDNTPTRGLQNQIWTMDLNGKNQEVLVAQPGFKYERPFWSSDCRYIAYARLAPGEDKQWQIEIIEFDLPELGPAILGQGRYPAWIPGEYLLVFNHLIYDRVNYPSFAMVDLEKCRLVPGEKEADCHQDTSRFKYQGSPIQGLQPAVSLDGKRLAFTTHVLTQNDQTYKYIQGFDLDGSGPVYNLTTSRGLYTDEYPTWGPDLGSTLVYFQSWRRQNTNIWSVGVEGANLTPIGPNNRINITVTYQMLAVDLLGD